MRIREIAAVRPSWGSPRIHVLLRREGWPVNHKRTERLYRLEGLNLRRHRPRRRKAVVTRGPAPAPTRRDETRGGVWTSCTTSCRTDGGSAC
jgi:putative transposase